MSSSVIIGAARTPVGKFGGALHRYERWSWGARPLPPRWIVSGCRADQIDEVIFGQVLQAGEGQITARQAAVRGGCR